MTIQTFKVQRKTVVSPLMSQLEIVDIVTLADHEHALAEKDVEIEKLQGWFDKVAASGVVDNHIQTAEEFIEWMKLQARELERLKDKWRKRRQGLIDHYKSQYNDLLRVAVEFAGWYKQSLEERFTSLELVDSPRYQEIKAFLATPAATALQQAKEARDAGVEAI